MKLFQRTFILIVISFISACSMQVSKVEDGIAPTAGIVTATLYPTFTPRPTETPIPATLIPTIEPVSGTVTAQINIREKPNASSEAVGVLDANSTVWIIGKNATGNWYQIYFDFPNGEPGKGWGSANYISTTSKPNVPVTSGESPSSAEDETNGEITQTVNVRSGPGIAFDALGVLDQGSRVVLTGKIPDETWLEIKYDTGTGWIFATYVQSDEIDALPIAAGAAEQATAIAATAEPVYTPAPEDGDSSEEPAISVIFSATNSRAFNYSSDLSSPDGDFEDWVAFHPNSTEDRVNLLIDLSCEGNGNLYVELWQGGILLDEWGELKCGDSDYALSMFQGETYQFRLFSKYSRSLKYIRYDLQVRATP